MRKATLLLCTAMVGSLVLVGCQNQSSTNMKESQNESTEMSTQDNSSDETDSSTKNDEKKDGTIMGRIVSIEGDEITLATGGPGGGMGGSTPPENGTVPDKGTPPENQEGLDNKQKDAEQELDTKADDSTSDDNTSSLEDRGTPPSGGGEGSFDPGQMEENTTIITVSDSTLIQNESGEELEVSDLEVGSMIAIELDDNSAPIQITVQSNITAPNGNQDIGEGSSQEPSDGENETLGNDETLNNNETLNSDESL